MPGCRKMAGLFAEKILYLNCMKLYGGLQKENERIFIAKTAF